MLYSIGHSTLSITDFLKLIEPIDIVMDVRSHPTSKWPQFHKPEMEQWLPEHNKKYEFEPRLGGWNVQHAQYVEEMKKHDIDITPYLKGKFPKGTIAKTKEKLPLFEDVPSKPCWYNVGLLDYSWFMSLPDFITAAESLIQRGQKENIGILCGEALWWKCHRSMISDYVVWRHSDIIHLQPKQVMHSEVISNRIERYGQNIINTWEAQCKLRNK